MEIVPGLLESNKAEFKAKLDKLMGFASRIQVDFNDGSFSGFVSVKPEDIVEFIVGPSASLRTSSAELEAHLMVQQPRGHEWTSELVNLGFRKIIIQYEIEDNIREVLEEVKTNGMLTGLAIGPATAVSEIEPYADLLDTITVMDIEPGKQGQKFLPEELAKVKELRDGNFPGEIQVDGAITVDTIQDIVVSKPDTLIVGSYIVNSADPKESYETLWKFLK